MHLLSAGDLVRVWMAKDGLTYMLAFGLLSAGAMGPKGCVTATPFDCIYIIFWYTFKTYLPIQSYHFFPYDFFFCRYAFKVLPQSQYLITIRFSFLLPFYSFIYYLLSL